MTPILWILHLLLFQICWGANYCLGMQLSFTRHRVRAVVVGSCVAVALVTWLHLLIAPWFLSLRMLNLSPWIAELLLLATLTLGGQALGLSFAGLAFGSRWGVERLERILKQLLVTLAVLGILNMAGVQIVAAATPLGESYFHFFFRMHGFMLFLLRMLLGIGLPSLYGLLALFDRSVVLRESHWMYFVPITALIAMGQLAALVITVGRGLAL